jgi:hypothetical protein
MRKFTISTLLFPVLFGLTVTAGSQTRPRRVSQPTNTSSVSNNISAPTNAEARTQERPRATSERIPAAREGVRRESRWPGMLLGMGLSIGASRIGHGSSCSPSRGAILSGPRFISLGSDR